MAATTSGPSGGPGPGEGDAERLRRPNATEGVTLEQFISPRPRAQIERFEAGAQTNITRDIFRNDLSRARDNLEFLRVTVRTISQQVYERYDEDDEDLATASALGNLNLELDGTVTPEWTSPVTVYGHRGDRLQHIYIYGSFPFHGHA